MLAVIVGSIIGYATNWLAIKMLFWPHVPKHVFGIKVPFTPGLFVRRRRDFSASLAHLVEERFVDVDDLCAAYYTAQERGLVKRFLDDMGPVFKIAYGLYARKTTPESFRRDCLQVARRLQEGHVIAKTLGDKIDSMPAAEVEGMILTVVRRELRGITWCGAAIGAAIGGVQACL